MYHKGFHLSGSSIPKILETLKILECDSVQFFIRTPMKTWHNSPLTKYNPDDIEKMKSAKLKIFTHASYTINLVKYTKVGKLSKPTILSLRDEIDFLRSVDGVGTVIHLGSTKNSDIVEWNGIVAVVINYIKAVVKNTKMGDVKLIIENRADAGQQVLKNVTEMIALWEAIEKANLDQFVGFCFDTCHDYVSNCKAATKSHDQYSGTEYSSQGKYRIDTNLQTLIDAVGAQNIPIVHLNDSKSDTRDMHENLLEGNIPHDQLVNVIKICKKYKIPMIIERIKTSIEEKISMKKIMDLW